ncbi:MAG TPA: DUF948 domain-containing protein [Planctomycetota bacterium]|nr:DUF948 domain-containing protein [Planctomycetota bacterium]
MIKINLLPLDKRKTERTPLKGAGLMIADALVAGVVVILVIISLIQIGHVNTQIDQQTKTLASLQDDVRKHDQLLAKSIQLQKDFNDLEMITAARPFLWSEVFDAIWDAVNKHKRVWLDTIEVTDGKQMDTKFKQMDGKTPFQGGKYGIALKSHVGGIDVKGMTAFRGELKENEVLSRFFPVVNFDTQWSVMEQKEFADKFSIDFDVLLVNMGQTSANTPVPTGKKATP